MQNNIAKVAAITSFSIKFSNSTATRNATIYGNGNNQVAVTVEAVLQDKDGKAVILTADELWENLIFRRVENNEIIAKHDTSPQFKHPAVWNIPGKYERAVKYGSFFNIDAIGLTEVVNKDKSEAVVYLTSGDSKSFEFYVELKLNNWIATTQGGNGEGHFLSHLNITVLDAVNYSQQSLWSLEQDKWIEKGKLEVENQGNAGSFTSKAISRYRKIHLVSKGGSKLKNFDYDYDIFSKVGRMNLRGEPSAVFGWGLNENNYNVIAWWVRPGDETEDDTTIGFLDNSSCDLKNDLYDITLNLKGDAVHITVDAPRDDAITLYQWNLCFEDRPYVHPRGWSDKRSDTVVTVTDEFGNFGKIKFLFPTNKWDMEVQYGN